MRGDRSKEALQVSKLCKNSLDTLPTKGNKKSTLESSNQGHKSQQFHPDQGHAFPTLTRDYLRIQQTKPKGPVDNLLIDREHAVLAIIQEQ